MLARRGVRWLVGAVLAGLLPAVLLAGLTTRAALDHAAVARLARDAARLAAELPARPPGLLLLSGRVAVAPEDLPPELAAALSGRPAAGPKMLRHPSGLLASHPSPDGRGTVALWLPAAQIEARLLAILGRGLRDAALLFLLALPAAWVGARLLLAPLAEAARGGASLLDALRAADLAAERSETPLEARPVLAEAPRGADPGIVTAAAEIGGMLERLDATAAALLRAETSAALA